MQHRQSKSRDDRWLHLGLLLLAILAAVLAISYAKPDVPNTITLLTGPRGSSLYHDGLRYRDILARHGVTVDVVQTEGSIANLQGLLAGCGACAGFAEAVEYPEPLRGTEGNELVTLGSIYVEPLWVFVRRELNIKGATDLRDLRGLAISPGNQGSGVRLFAEALLKWNGLTDNVKLVDADSRNPDQLRTAIESGKIDVVFAAGKTDAPLIDGLLRTPELLPVSLRRIDAISFRYPGVTALRLPAGSQDMALNIPASDVDLLGISMQMIVPASLPAALSDLLLEAAREVHGERGPFAQRGEFPNPTMVSLPLSRAAVRYYERGPSPLWRFLPFRLATLVDRFMWIAASVASAALALFGLLPKLLSFRYQRASLALYQRLECIEKALGTNADKRNLLAELDDIERISTALRVPKQQRSDYFGLRQNIYDVRTRLMELLGSE
jgi:TRAP-type uncharacterized transport system substrate-binding protein